MHRSEIFVWLDVLKEIFSAVLLHPAQNPLTSAKCLEINVRLGGIGLSINQVAGRTRRGGPNLEKQRTTLNFDCLSKPPRPEDAGVFPELFSIKFRHKNINKN